MPFESQAQRRFMYAKHPEIAKRWEKHTSKGEKLPEKVKEAFSLGVADAFDDYGLKTAAQEIRLQIPRREFHGFDDAFRTEATKNLKKAEEAPEGGSSPADRLTEILQALPEPPPPSNDTRKDPLDREVLWGNSTNLSGGDAGSRVNDMGQPTAVGAAF